MERLPILGFQREAGAGKGVEAPMRLLGWEAAVLTSRGLWGRSAPSVGSGGHSGTCVLGGENAVLCGSLPSSSLEWAPFHLVTR